MRLRLTNELTRQYLHRIGLTDEPRPPAIDWLHTLHRAHLDHIPFENLSIHLGETIELAPSMLVAKLTTNNRGGFCYELNGAFAALLTALGFQVELLEARVYKEGKLGIRFDHLCLKVTLGDSPLGHTWLCDVGFGQSHRNPLRLSTLDSRLSTHSLTQTVTTRLVSPMLMAGPT